MAAGGVGEEANWLSLDTAHQSQRRSPWGCGGGAVSEDSSTCSQHRGRPRAPGTSQNPQLLLWQTREFQEQLLQRPCCEIKVWARSPNSPGKKDPSQAPASQESRVSSEGEVWSENHAHAQAEKHSSSSDHPRGRHLERAWPGPGHPPPPQTANIWCITANSLKTLFSPSSARDAQVRNGDKNAHWPSPGVPSL